MDRRARALPGEYRRDLGKLDRQFHGTVAGQIGPLVRRFEELVGEDGLQCLVVGRFGEVNCTCNRVCMRTAMSICNNETVLTFTINKIVRDGICTNTRIQIQCR